MRWLDLLWYKEDREACKDIEWMQEEINKKPICLECGKYMKNARDTITKKISKYLWVTSCDCEGMKNFKLSIG